MQIAAETNAGSLTAGLPCGYHLICEIVILFEIRLGDSMVNFSGGKSNAPPKNSHPLSWEGTMLLLFDVQGSVRKTDLLVLTEVRARGTAVSLCSYCPASAPTLPGTGFSSAWVHHYEQGLMKQRLPHFNVGSWCPLPHQWHL